MNQKQYETILSTLADKIKEQNEQIAFQKWQIENLEKKLAEAEYHLNPTEEKPKTLEIR